MSDPFPFSSNAILQASQLNELGDMKTFAPTFNNVTMGASGTVGGRYAQIQNLVFYKAAFFLNGTGSVTGHVSLDLPVGTGDASSTYHVSTQSWLRPAGLTIFHGMGYQSASEVFLYAYSTTGSFASIQPVNATQPAAWTSAGSGYVSGWYLTT